MKGTIVPYPRMTKQDLITAIEDYSLRAGISPATTTGRAVGNSRLYARMVSGGSCTMDVAERVLAYIRANPVAGSDLASNPQPAATAAQPQEHPHVPDLQNP